MAKELTEKQTLFLEYLFMSEEEGGAAGDALKAKRLAGYSDNFATAAIIDSLKEEINARTKNLFVKFAPRAAFRTSSVLEDPTMMGAKELLAASKDLLDRAGFGKTDKVEVDFSQGLFILPAKKEEEDE